MMILKLRNHPEWIHKAAQWFHEKWGVPKEAYLDSMQQMLQGASPVPQWYIDVEEGTILGGLGVIHNDFHNRKDLSPNVCAVYVNEDCRCRGIAGQLLHAVCDDMAALGVKTLYLLTDHTSFYERYGWQFFCMAQGDGEEHESRMYVHQAQE